MKNRLELFRQTKLDSTTTWLLFLFLGWSYGSFKQPAYQFFYYLVLGVAGALSFSNLKDTQPNLYHIILGGALLWYVIRLITLGDDIREHNSAAAVKCRLSEEEMDALGIYPPKKD